MGIAPLIEPYASDHVQLLALCIWREARSEPVIAKLGVAWTIRNRCAMAPAQGFKSDFSGNILKPWAFASFMEGDPNAKKYPSPGGAQADRDAWADSLNVAQSVLSDPTAGAVFYFSAPLTAPPVKRDGSCAWGDVVHTVTLGGLQFYRMA